MPTLDERYGQLWWNPETGMVQDDRPAYAEPAAPAAPQYAFLPGSTNIYRDEQGVIRNLRPSEAPAPAEDLSLLGVRRAVRNFNPETTEQLLERARAAQTRAVNSPYNDPGARGEWIAAEQELARREDAAAAQQQQAYKMADYLAQFLPPERILPEVERMTGVRLGATTTPNLLARREKEVGIRATQAQAAEREEDAVKKAQERREAPVREYGALESTMNGLNRIEAVAAQLRDAPGLWRAAGPVASKAPTISGRTADIERKVENLKSNLALRTLAQIRDESKTGGALGNVSNYDVQLLENAIANVSLAQSPEAFRKAMDDVIAYSRNLREQAGRAYAGKHGAPPKVLPRGAMQKLQEAPPGEPVRFGNGQVWVVKNGVPVRVR